MSERLTISAAAQHSCSDPGWSCKSLVGSVTAVTALLGIIASPVTAIAQQDQESEASSRTLEEITVTATRRETLASDTPIALTVMTGATIEENGLTDAKKLGEYTPNLGIGAWAGGLQITMRGITNSDPTERGDPAAGFLMDDVYIPRPNGIEVAFFDLNRIEVLRGPQGTLFGRNTTAGAINVITNRPVFQPEGSVKFAAGEYSSFQGTAVYNAPISDTFAIRAGVNYDTRDNYLEEGPAVTTDLSPFKENFAVRLQALKTWDTGEILVRGEHASIGGNYVEYVPLNHFYTAYPAAGEDAVWADRSTSEILDVNYPAVWDMERDNKNNSFGIELKQALGDSWDLTYIGGYRKLDRDEDEPRPDDDGDRLFRITWNGEYEQQSHEIRFSTSTDRLDFQTGLYYLSDDISQDLKLTLASGTDGNNPPGLTIWWNTPLLENESWAVFGEGTYSLTDALRLTAGVRYTDDTKTRNNAFQVFCAEYDCINETTERSPYDADGSWEKTTWRLGLDYDLTDTTMVYGTVSTGYKAGGFIDGCEVGLGPGCTFSAEALYYDPENIVSYELGAKGLMLDGTFNYSVALFHFSYDDMQQSAIQNNCFGPGTTSCTITTNAASAENTGLEFESTWLLTDYDVLQFDATWSDAKFDDYVAPARDFSGAPLPFSSDFTATVGYTHTFPLSSGAGIEASIRSKYDDGYWFVSAGDGSLFPQPSYSRTNIRLTYRSADSTWYVMAFADNLEDEVQVTNIIFGPTRRAASLTAPLTYGVRAGLSF